MLQAWFVVATAVVATILHHWLKWRFEDVFFISAYKDRWVLVLHSPQSDEISILQSQQRGASSGGRRSNMLVKLESFGASISSSVLSLRLLSAARSMSTKSKKKCWSLWFFCQICVDKIQKWRPRFGKHFCYLHCIICK